MNTFTLARPTDPRGPYHYMTDNRTPADVNTPSGYVDAWAVTTCGEYDLADWWDSGDRDAAINFISSWAEGATVAKYNGWANQATWQVDLWLNNNESNYLHWQEQTEMADSPSALANTLRAECTRQLPDLADIDAVDWQRLAIALWDAHREAGAL